MVFVFGSTFYWNTVQILHALLSTSRRLVTAMAALNNTCEISGQTRQHHFKNQQLRM